MSRFSHASLKSVLIILLVLSFFSLSLFSFSSSASTYPSKVSTSLQFDGRTGGLTVNGTFAEQRIRTNGITVAVWSMIYPQNPQGASPIFDQKGSQFSLSAGSNNGTRFEWQVSNSSTLAATTSSQNDFTFFAWYFLSATWNAPTGNMTLYINGDAIVHGQGPTSTNLWSNQSSSQWLVGRSHFNSSLYGRIANLQIYSGVLSPDKIRTLNGLGRTGQPLFDSSLEEWWSLDGNYFSYDGRNNLQPNSGVQWIEFPYFVFPYDILSVLAVFSTVASAIALSPWIPGVQKLRILNPLRDKYRLFVVAVFSKIFLALITPLSLDFLNILQSSSFSAAPLGFSPSEGGFWLLIVHAFGQLWNLTPVSHPNLQPIFLPPFDIYKNNVPLPAGSYLIPFFTQEGSSGLFAWVMLAKLPYIIVDVGIGLVIYRITLAIVGDHKVASMSMILWLFNPMSTILIDLWSSNDAPMVLFLASSVYTLLIGRKALSAFFFGLAIAVRLLPLVFLPVMLFALLQGDKSARGNSSSGYQSRAVELFRKLRLPIIIAATAIIPNIPLVFVKSLPIISAPSSQPSSILLSSSYEYLFGITFAGPTLNLGGFRYGTAIILLSVYSIFVAKTWNRGTRFVLDSFLGLILTLLVLSQWNAQYWLWILPFMLTRNYYDSKFKNFFLAQLSLLILINLTIFSFYYSTFGHSIFFFPNYTPLAQTVSTAFLHIHEDPIFIGLRLDEVLISSFAAVNIWILAKLSWPRISRRIIKSLPPT